MFCETTNLLNSLAQTTVTNVISKFVAFKILIQVQDYYNRSRANFRIRSAVSSYPLVIVVDIQKVLGQAKAEASSRRSSQRDAHYQSFLADLEANRNAPKSKKRDKQRRALIIVMYYVYKLLRAFYTTIYFYFFPLFVIAIPFVRMI